MIRMRGTHTRQSIFTRSGLPPPPCCGADQLYEGPPREQTEKPWSKLHTASLLAELAHVMFTAVGGRVPQVACALEMAHASGAVVGICHHLSVPQHAVRHLVARHVRRLV